MIPPLGAPNLVPFGVVTVRLEQPRDVVPDGVIHHRETVRRLGPWLSVAVAAGIGVVAAMLLVNSTSAWRGIPGFVLAVLAVPTLPLFGVPVMGGSVRWVLAIGTSAVGWWLAGRLAARRSTNRVVSSWPEWRREWTRLAVGVWAGALTGLLGAVLLLSVGL